MLHAHHGDEHHGDGHGDGHGPGHGNLDDHDRPERAEGFEGEGLHGEHPGDADHGRDHGDDHARASRLLNILPA